MLSLISLNKTVLAKLQNYRKNVAFFKLLRMNLYFKGGGAFTNYFLNV